MSLSFGTNVNTCEIVADGMEIGEARSQVASGCLKQNPQPEYLFFLDSDVIVPNDGFVKLFYHLKTKPHVDIAAGVYVAKGVHPYDPLIYRNNGEGAFWDWAVGDLLSTRQHGIKAVHMGLTMIRTSLFQRMKDAGLVHGDGTDQGDEPFFCTESFTRERPDGGRETKRGTEDIYFCAKAAKLPGGCQILVDTSVLAGHHDRKTGITYGIPGDTSPIERAKWLPIGDGSGLRKDQKEAMENEEECPECEEGTFVTDQGVGYVGPCPRCKGTGKIKVPLKLAIDLGAGESRREWPGYVTYTLDSRRDSGADYCQEMESLNLPPNHYDLVASRHAFEHVARFDQERLWAEAFKICKTDGKCEICVPNLEWAAEKIAAGEVDFHVFNVLYGGQESSTDMPREANTHKFGYTPAVLRALAEGAGFVDCVIEDFRTHPELTYHMVLRGRKPLLPEPEAEAVPEPVVESPSHNGNGAVEHDVPAALAEDVTP